ncbi:M56 family metallopeptidase [Streptomyces sp. VRA16 Mangrove soil]|uniref:M56 family metallopeptidase n=1 Tax=Streptomyces sp. VRA16 Mangrove soil TaxID=2817434 RepID=UPI001A9EBA8B|nr:M56 family metallopeptidase [Streptomyces sp. VRA16 Mangrove soil]MBO1330412.1 M56 family metallopeptidase [Streptomyces sp. VRA16 Mangrove soil]
MNYAVWLPLLVPLLAVPVARRAADRLAPRAAVWTLSVAAVTLAACSTLALGTLLLAGALRLPPVAALENIRPHWLDAPSWWTAPAAVAAGLGLAVCAAGAGWRLLSQRRELRRARAALGPTAGDLSVDDHHHPYAYALPGTRGASGSVVVSSAMLQALAPAERDALLAHERAHLRGRHHLFLGAAQLCAILHPALRALRPALSFHLERLADEAAASAVGDRRLTARAISRAALAAHDSRTRPPRPSAALGATTGPVPQRVLALLTPAATAPRRAARHLGQAVAAALLCCLALSAAGALDAFCDLHADVEVAQTYWPTGP